MTTQAQIRGLGEFTRREFTLDHADDHIVELRHQDELVARFSQVGATEGSIQGECARHQVMNSRAEQTIRSLETLATLTASGLFVTKLNSGEWMAGKASYIYQMDITQDHYADPNLVIANTLPQVLSAARVKFSGGQNYEH